MAVLKTFLFVGKASVGIPVMSAEKKSSSHPPNLKSRILLLLKKARADTIHTLNSCRIICCSFGRMKRTQPTEQRMVYGCNKCKKKNPSQRDKNCIASSCAALLILFSPLSWPLQDPGEKELSRWHFCTANSSSTTTQA